MAATTIPAQCASRVSLLSFVGAAAPRTQAPARHAHGASLRMVPVRGIRLVCNAPSATTASTGRQCPAKKARPLMKRGRHGASSAFLVASEATLRCRLQPVAASAVRDTSAPQVLRAKHRFPAAKLRGIAQRDRVPPLPWELVTSPWEERTSARALGSAFVAKVTSARKGCRSCAHRATTAPPGRAHRCRAVVPPRTAPKALQHR